MTYDELYQRYEALLADHLRLILLMSAVTSPLREMMEQIDHYDNGDG